MCIAIYQNKGNEITDEQFNNCWQANPDGGGFAYITPDGEIKTQHYMKYKKMFAAYKAAMDQYGDSSPFLVHFRIATHGTVSIENCHPFRVTENKVMIHNGMIPVPLDKNDKRSDTNVFAQEYLSKLPANWLDDPYMVDMVEDYITTGSKIALLSTDTDYVGYILNQRLGHWTDENGIWWSNKSYERCTTKYTNPQSKWYKPSDIAPSDNSGIAECYLCETKSVYDGVCYECETCQRCSEVYDYCVCNSSIHSMSDHQFYSMHGIDGDPMQQQIPF